MKGIFALGWLILLPIFTFAQDAYFVTDSLTTIGADITNAGDKMNSKFCMVKIGKDVISYSPYEVNEYRFKKGNVYLSKEISLNDSIRKVFLEQLIKGNTSLYYYCDDNYKTYFISNESGELVEIPKKDRGTTKNSYHSILLENLSDCPRTIDAAKLAHYSNVSMELLIDRYNKCILRPFPHGRFGVIIGAETVTLMRDKEISLLFTDTSYEFDFNNMTLYPDKGLVGGIFIDLPLMPGDFSLHSEAFFSYHNYSYTLGSHEMSLDLIGTTASVSLPILFRYTLPTNIFRPFFNVGGSISYNFKIESGLYRSSIEPHTIEINKISTKDLFTDFYSGIVGGCGLEYQINYKHSVFIEFRYNKCISLNGYGTFGASVLQLLTSVNI